MLEFANIHQKAKQCVEQLIYAMRPKGCFGFFNILPQLIDNSAMENATTIKLLACTLESEANEFRLFLQSNKIPSYMYASKEEFNSFKDKIILGMYILLWAKQKTLVSYYFNQPLLDIFHNQLQCESLDQVTPELREECLNALKIYCAYTYGNKNSSSNYAKLHERLGDSIQVEIFIALNTRKVTQDTNVSYGCFTGLMGSLG